MPGISWSGANLVAYLIGPPDFERYVIKDNGTTDDRYFVGHDRPWTNSLKAATKYVDLNSLAADIEAINVREKAHLGITKYTLTVDVTVLGKADRQAIQDYLFDALTIDVDYENFGHGPANVTVMVHTNTDTLRQSLLERIRFWFTIGLQRPIVTISRRVLECLGRNPHRQVQSR